SNDGDRQGHQFYRDLRHDLGIGLRQLHRKLAQRRSNMCDNHTCRKGFLMAKIFFSDLSSVIEGS
ncbi:unnamed protein product, partial [Allacma fusca]